jgi:hypothetical protein
MQFVPAAVSLGVKRPVREADHSLPSSAEVIECVELYFHSPIRVYDMVTVTFRWLNFVHVLRTAVQGVFLFFRAKWPVNLGAALVMKM